MNRAFGKASIGKAEETISKAFAMGHKLAPVVGSRAAAIGWDMLGEGFEEGYQYITAEESKYLADKTRNPKSTSSFNERLNKYMADGEFWTNVSMGALGAGVMQTAGKAINDLIQGGDAQTKAVKEFGAKISQSAQSVQFADLIGSASGKDKAITLLEKDLFSKHASLQTMEDAKEMIKRASNPTEADLAGILKDLTPEAVELMRENGPEILKHAENYEALWNKNANRENQADITNQEFLIDTFNSHKKDYVSKLNSLKDNITNFNSLSAEAQDIFGITSQILANDKKIKFFEKLADNKDNNPEQKKEYAKSIETAKRDDKRLRANLDTITALREVPESDEANVKAYDDSINIGGPYNLLGATEKDIKGHAILEYLKAEEALSFADATLSTAQRRLDSLLSTKKQPKQPAAEKPFTDRVPETDDYVTYTADGKPSTGIVDSIDENGDYVIIPTVPWTEGSTIATKPTDTKVTVSKDKVKLDQKIYTEDETTNEPVTKDEVADEAEGVDVATDVFLDASYMHYVDGVQVPLVRNDALHRFLVASNGNLEGIVAEMYVDTTSDYAIGYWQKNNVTDKELERIREGKFTQALIDDLFGRATSDTIPIEILLTKDGKAVVSRGGLYYHDTTFKRKSVPDFIEDKDAYLKDQEKNYVRLGDIY